MKTAISVFFLSMLPVFELRLAIPAGALQGLNPWLAYAICVCGNMVPVPFIILFIRKIFKWMRSVSVRLDSLVTRLENKANSKAETVLKYEKLGLLLFVAIPIPGTGAWTGALIAAMLDMRLKSSVPTIFLGVLIAGFIVTLLTLGVISL